MRISSIKYHIENIRTRCSEILYTVYCILYRREHRAFTLIETFVAVSILSVAVVAPLTLAHRSLTTARYARDQVVASNLAQDAVEFVRAARDRNLIRIARTGAGSWIAGLPVSNPTGSARPFIVDSVTGLIEECPGGVCPVILFDSSSSLYTYAVSGRPTLFTRTVTLRQSATNDLEVTLRVVVSWRSAVIGSQRTVVLEDELYGWLTEQN